METGMLGIIGGTGIYEIDGIEFVKEHEVLTPFGKPSSNIVEAKVSGSTFYFLPRHGKHHSILPSEINYRANIFAMKKLGVKYIVSVSAVGSLKEEHSPNTFVLPDQFIDWTKGKRERSFFGNGIVGHVSTALPIEVSLSERIAKSCEATDVSCSMGGTYICIEGPQFSTKAESNIYRSFGATVIGMTNVPESYLAKEAGIAYATVAMVTDYDCWKEEHCTLEQILEYVSKNNESAKRVLLDFIPKFCKNPIEFNSENANCVVTKRESMSEDQLEVINILLR